MSSNIRDQRAKFKISVWLPVAIVIGVIAIASTSWFGADQTSGPLRAIYQAIFAGLLVAIGIGGVCAALLTLRVIRQQTNALISGQRAWVLLIKTRGPLGDEWYAPQSPAYTPGMAFDFEVCGDTAIRITETRFFLHPIIAQNGELVRPGARKSLWILALSVLAGLSVGLAAKAGNFLIVDAPSRSDASCRIACRV